MKTIDFKLFSRPAGPVAAPGGQKSKIRSVRFFYMHKKNLFLLAVHSGGPWAARPRSGHLRSWVQILEKPLEIPMSLYIAIWGSGQPQSGQEGSVGPGEASRPAWNDSPPPQTSPSPRRSMQEPAGAVRSRFQPAEVDFTGFWLLSGKLSRGAGNNPASHCSHIWNLAIPSFI